MSCMQYTRMCIYYFLNATDIFDSDFHSFLSLHYPSNCVLDSCCPSNSQSPSWRHPLHQNRIKYNNFLYLFSKLKRVCSRSFKLSCIWSFDIQWICKHFNIISLNVNEGVKSLLHMIFECLKGMRTFEN